MLRRSRLRLRVGLRDVRVVRPSRGPRATRACPRHPRSRASQVVRASGNPPPSIARPRADTQPSLHTLRTRVRVLRDSGRVLPELRDRLTKNSGLPLVLRPPRPQWLLMPALLCQHLGISGLLRTQPPCPFCPKEVHYMESVLGTKAELALPLHKSLILRCPFVFEPEGWHRALPA